MLKANVGLSRKISRDYQSTGYTINVEGEIAGNPDQPDAVMSQIDRLFQLAEMALDQEIDRDQSEQAIGRRDQEPASSQQPAQQSRDQANGRQQTNGRPSTNGKHAEPATQKQTGYIETLRKRSGMTNAQLDAHIEQVLGHRASINQISKLDAGKVIESLSQPVNGRR